MRARKLFFGLMFMVGVAFATAPAGAVGLGDLGSAFGARIAVQDDPPVIDVVPDVDIDVHRTERIVWYTNPLVVGGAVLALILVVALVARGGGGTTVVKG